MNHKIQFLENEIELNKKARKYSIIMGCLFPPIWFATLYIWLVRGSRLRRELMEAKMEENNEER